MLNVPATLIADTLIDSSFDHRVLPTRVAPVAPFVYVPVVRSPRWSSPVTVAVIVSVVVPKNMHSGAGIGMMTLASVPVGSHTPVPLKMIWPDVAPERCVMMACVACG